MLSELISLMTPSSPTVHSAIILLHHQPSQHSHNKMVGSLAAFQERNQFCPTTAPNVSHIVRLVYRCHGQGRDANPSDDNGESVVPTGHVVTLALPVVPSYLLSTRHSCISSSQTEFHRSVPSYLEAFILSSDIASGSLEIYFLSCS